MIFRKRTTICHRCCTPFNWLGVVQPDTRWPLCFPCYVLVTYG